MPVDNSSLVRCYSDNFFQLSRPELILREIYIFADETGDLGYTSSSSKYFGFGTVTIHDSLPEILWLGFKLRCELEQLGHELKIGFHAKVDKYAIKKEIFLQASRMNLVYDFTFLNKKNAYQYIIDRGEVGLYKMAWYLHFKFIAQKYLSEDVRLVVIVADIQTKAKKSQLRTALEEVATQFPHVTTSLFIWSSQSSWGLQLADYGIWAAQRNLLRGYCEFWDLYISKRTESIFFPWGK